MLLVERPSDGVALVVINRPEAMNALSKALRARLHETLQALDADPDIRVMILTGAGERAFSAGLDLKELGSDPEGMRAANATDPAENPARAVLACRKPVIAAVNGVAYGGGFALALACDLRIAAPSARFCAQFIKIGLSGCDIGISYTLPRAVGSSRAFDLILTSRVVDADEALSMGLVSAVAVDPVERALETAEVILGYSPFGVAMTKEVMWANLDASSIESAIHLENRTQILASTGGEVVEAATAFMEKRDPDWSRVSSRGVWDR